MAAAAAHLGLLGYAVVPIVAPEAVNALALAYTNALATLPEFRQENVALPDFRYAKTGFGALGTSSSIHNRFVRQLRALALVRALPLFAALRQVEADPKVRGTDVRPATRRLESIIDRMCVRYPGTAPTAEMWHRDLTPPSGDEAEADDTIYGGWINCDPTGRMQYFSCIAGSHLFNPVDLGNVGGDWTRVDPAAHAAASHDGFAAFDRKASAEFTTLKNVTLSPGKDPNETRRMQTARLRANYNVAYERVVVPPGHMLIFYQDLIHEVVSKRVAEDTPSQRLFTGWRLTRSAQTFRYQRNIFGDMSLPYIKSGQAITMYSTMNFTNPESLVKWSHTSIVEELETYRMPSTGEMIVPRDHMKSVAAIRAIRGINVEEHAFPDYTDAERALYAPNTTWRLGEHAQYRLSLDAPQAVDPAIAGGQWVDLVPDDLSGEEEDDSSDSGMDLEMEAAGGQGTADSPYILIDSDEEVY